MNLIFLGALYCFKSMIIYLFSSLTIYLYKNIDILGTIMTSRTLGGKHGDTVDVEIQILSDLRANTFLNTHGSIKYSSLTLVT